MKRTLAFVIALSFVLGLPAVAQAQRSPLNRDPQAARIVQSDVANFWAAFDAAGPSLESLDLEGPYFGRASPGLAEFRRLRMASCDALRTARWSRDYLRAARDGMRLTDAQVASLRESFAKLKAIYPESVFPDVYLVVGCMTSAGTIADVGLLIGVEMFGRTDAPLPAKFGPWLQANIKRAGDMPSLIVHELIHYQQRLPESQSLLATAIREGVPDFVAELVAARVNPHVHRWAEGREAQLWEEFRQEMHGPVTKRWAYGQPDEADRPADLAYYMGFRIAQSLYERAADKHQALVELLVVRDYDELLRRSGYAPGAGR